MIPEIAIVVGGIDDDIVRIEIVVHVLPGQVGQSGKHVRLKRRGLFDQSAPVGSNSIDQRTQFGGMLKIPEQLVIGRRDG